MVIIYGYFELLVTGGIYSDLNNSGLKSFLGANIKFKNPIKVDSTPSIYILQPALSDYFIIKEECLLQNYSRQAADYKWKLRSAKDFKTLNSL
jgi:hypothetical protein